MCNRNTNLKVKYQQELSEKFEVKSGLRQGDAIATDAIQHCSGMGIENS